MINTLYLQVIDPKNIRSHFKTNDEFIAWLETGSIEDLKCTLQAFEDAEMYEDCITINNLVKKHGTSNTNFNQY